MTCIGVAMTEKAWLPLQPAWQNRIEQFFQKYITSLRAWTTRRERGIIAPRRHLFIQHINLVKKLAQEIGITKVCQVLVIPRKSHLSCTKSAYANGDQLQNLDRILVRCTRIKRYKSVIFWTVNVSKTWHLVKCMQHRWMAILFLKHNFKPWIIVLIILNILATSQMLPLDLSFLWMVQYKHHHSSIGLMAQADVH